MRPRLIALLCLAAAFLTAGVASGQTFPTQTSSISGVTVKATPRALTGGAWEFDVVFDTHTQDLKDDLMKSASLVADGKTIAPAVWRGDSPGGHHRKGVLRFNAVSPPPKAMELTLTRLGEPKPRSFRWQLK
jgi:hypothetical protein